MASIKAPCIYCIDGTDGSGKGTVSEMVQKKLEEDGFRVAVISPPFYDTVTGTLVTELLQRGAGAMQDRDCISMLYSLDRNMYYRNYFDRIYRHNNYDIVLYNRNWLSNVFYQTTLIANTPAATQQLRPCGCKYYFGHSDVNEFYLYELHDFFNPLKLGMGMPNYEKAMKTMDAIAQWLEPDELDANEGFVTVERARIVREHMKLLHSLELAPWHIYKTSMGGAQNHSYSWNFVCEAFGFKSWVLCPSLDDEGVKVIEQNLMRRYDNDLSRLDLNEANPRYQLAVIENIHWIHDHWDYIRDPRCGECEPGMSWAYSYYLGSSRPKTLMDSEVIMPFQYDIITTTKPGTTEQVPLEDIANQIYNEIAPEAGVWKREGGTP
jgi:hypothetical protein